MIKLADFLSKSELDNIAKQAIRIGDVYRIEMNRANGITPKAGDDSRNKFFVVLGFDAEGNAYLSHDSFVDCSKLKSVSLEKFEKWEFKGRMDDEDVQLIIATVKGSPNENPKHLAMYGLS